MQSKIKKPTVEALKPGEILADVEIKGFTARCLPSGVVSYGLRYRAAGGQQRWMGLGVHGKVTPDQARKAAKRAVGRVAGDHDPAAERAEAHKKAKAEAIATINLTLDTFLARHVHKNLRGAGEVERSFNKYVRPAIGSKSIYHLRRSDVVEMLDGIEDGHGIVMADRVLAYLRKCFNWQAARDDRFNSPIIIGMARTKGRERARKRTLDDRELRDLWRALDGANTGYPACFPSFVRTLLLTAQRRCEVSRMSWGEIEGDLWVIPAERDGKQGHKTADESGEKVVPLTPEVLAQLGQPGKARDFVFTSTKGRKPFSGFSKAKAGLDKKITELRKADGRPPMASWGLHDLRRTGRSLLSRAGVPADIAERTLGHVIAGVRSVYDRYEYVAEKRDALERLARLVESILNPQDNVVPLARRQR